jgi:hypothetical protein
MFDRIAYTELTAFITNQLPSGTTFALNEHDSAEQIFIPSQLARVQNILPGDRVRVRAIPNKREGGAQWFAVFISPILDDHAETVAAPVAPPAPAVTQIVATPAAPAIDWYASAKAALKKLGGVATTAEVGAECGCETQHISTYLRVLHERGDICRAGIRTSSKQSKDSLVYWGLTLDDLLPAGMTEEGEE